MEINPRRYNHVVESIAMLTANRVTELRGKVKKANRLRASEPFALTLCADVPLGGQNIRLAVHESRSRTTIVGQS
jgi:hypothetical protein